MSRENSDFMTVEELAERLGISRSRAYGLIREENLPFKVVFVGNRILISRVSYEKFYKEASKINLPIE